MKYDTYSFAFAIRDNGYGQHILAVFTVCSSILREGIRCWNAVNYNITGFGFCFIHGDYHGDAHTWRLLRGGWGSEVTWPDITDRANGH